MVFTEMEEKEVIISQVLWLDYSVGTFFLFLSNMAVL